MDATELNNLLSQLSSGVNSTSGAFQQLQQSLASATSATGQSATASTYAAQAMTQYAQRQNAISQSISTAGGVITGTVNAFSTVSSSIYGTDKAFTAFIPTLNFVTDTLTKTVQALALFGSGVQAATFSTGRMSEALAAGFAKTVDAATSLLRNQLEASQRVVDAFLDVAKVGAIFNGSLGSFANVAATIQIPMQSLQKIVAANVENISKLGIGMNKGTYEIASMGKEIFRTEDRLVALYGSVENLTSATADYLALQAQLGVDIRKNAEREINGAIEYLFRQRELAAITGKTVENLKREEEARRKQLDYNLKLGRLGDVAKQNVQEGMTLAGKIFGDQGSRYLEEYFATGGKVYSKEALTYAATNQEAVAALENMAGSFNDTREGFRKGVSSYLTANADILEASARNAEEIAEINRGANSPILKGITDTGTSIIENLTMIRTGLSEMDFEGARKKMDEALDATTQSFVNAQRVLTANQLEVDKIVRENIGKMALVVDTLSKVNLMLLAGQDTALATINTILEASVKGVNGLEELAKKVVSDFGQQLLDEQRRRQQPNANREPMPLPSTNNPLLPPTATPATPAAPPNTVPATPTTPPPASNLPGRAEGGLTTGPTQVGEDGTEAVIPLKGGKIPLEIDLEPLVSVLSENLQKSQEIIDELRDANDIHQKILNASY